VSAASGAAAEPAPAPPEETLAREAAGRARTAAGAAFGAIATLVGGLIAASIYRDFPRVPLVDALRDAAGRPLPGREGLRTEQILFYDDKASQLLIVSIVLALGALALILPLGYLYQAAKARRPQTPNVALVMAVTGPVMLAVSELVLQIDVMIKASDFVSAGDFSTEAAHDVLKGGLLVAAQVLRQVAVLALGFAFVMIALHAMRAGLLTRFMGTLGIIVGVLFVIPLGSQLPVVQTFWLLALAALLIGRWPNAIPPAWSTGRAEPWPTQQELREARERERGGGAAPAAETEAARPRGLRRKSAPAPEPEGLADAPEQPEGKLHPSSKKKKRRRN
jgi:hypothetical protein